MNDGLGFFFLNELTKSGFNNPFRDCDCVAVIQLAARIRYLFLFDFEVVAQQVSIKSFVPLMRFLDVNFGSGYEVCPDNG